MPPICEEIWYCTIRDPKDEKHTWASLRFTCTRESGHEGKHSCKVLIECDTVNEVRWS